MRRAWRRFCVHDVAQARLGPLLRAGALRASGLAELAESCDTIFLSLPDAAAVASVVLGPDGLAGACHPGQTVVDLSTSRIPLAQEIAERLLGKG